ncbi:hypothetical protein LINPERPRIM_LOCUS7844 [Linum perenne]
MSQPAGDQPSSSTSTAAGYEILKPYNAKAQAKDCCNFIFFILLLISLIAAVPAVTTLLIYLQPSLPTFAVNSSSVTVVNVSSSLITSQWNLTFSVTNPNGDALSYNHLFAYAVSGAHGRLSNTTLTPFRQPGHGTTASLSASFPSLQFVTDDCTANTTIVAPCSPVQLSFEMEVAAVYDGKWTWPDRGNLVKVECDVANVVFMPNSTTTEVGPAACRSDARWRRLEDKCGKIFWDYVYVATMCLGILAFSL